MADIIKLRGDTAANWASIDPVLNVRELALDLTNDTIKIGDGVSTYSALPLVDGSTDVTVAAGLDYITISGQILTLGAVVLTTDVSGLLPLANIADVSAASRLIGRGSAGGAGVQQELSLGSKLAIVGTTLTVVTGTSGATIPLLNGANTWATTQIFSATVDASPAGIFLGGTAAVNKVDFAETGLFTPELSDTTTPVSKSQTYALQFGGYGVLGDRVHCIATITMASLGTLLTGNQAFLLGMPFVSEGSAGNNALSSVLGFGLALVSANDTPLFQLNRGQSFGGLFVQNLTSGVSTLPISRLTATSSINIAFTYQKS